MFFNIPNIFYNNFKILFNIPNIFYNNFKILFNIPNIFYNNFKIFFNIPHIPNIFYNTPNIQPLLATELRVCYISTFLIRQIKHVQCYRIPLKEILINKASTTYTTENHSRLRIAEASFIGQRQQQIKWCRVTTSSQKYLIERRCKQREGTRLRYIQHTGRSREKQFEHSRGL
ncbi:hypothetical protein HELRODRAFT_184134 [Helobdella robusta]|uniref:Uncharacterized protein n=1 Tax=Helobdella robusta TaxID=6412 RepID=T1FKN1_HELRO|nr:hypothetical protein HELRODRAFT_184134 [Helobdella robusta]ESO07439.1 hypothetical protein HELRODRAFT_184134 [Helobdella robusta]